MGPVREAAELGRARAGGERRAVELAPVAAEASSELNVTLAVAADTATPLIVTFGAASSMVNATSTLSSRGVAVATVVSKLARYCR